MKFSLEINVDAAKSPKATICHAIHCLALRLVNFNEGMAGETEGRVGDDQGQPIGSWKIEEQPKAGKTLADFAGSNKMFKRPMHRNAYGFQQLWGCCDGGQLREISISEAGTCADWPRLTAEDLTATDWEEVKDYGPNNTTNTGEDGLLPALS
jgi:hypothetical protein